MPAPPRASSPRFQYRALAGDVSDKLEGSLPCQQGQGVRKPASPHGTARGRGTAGPGAAAGPGEAEPQPSPLCTATVGGSRRPPRPSPGTPPRPRGAQRPPGCHGAPRRGAPPSPLPVLVADPTSMRRRCRALDQCKPVRTSANQPPRPAALPTTQDRAEARSSKAARGRAPVHVCVPTRTHTEAHVHACACRHTRAWACRHMPVRAGTRVRADTRLCMQTHTRTQTRVQTRQQPFHTRTPNAPTPSTPGAPPVMPPHSHTLSPPTRASRVCARLYTRVCARVHACTRVCAPLPQGVRAAPGAHAGAPSVPLVTAPGLRWHLEPAASQAFCGWF